MIRLAALAALLAAAAFAAPAAADSDEEGVEKFRDGPCSVGREWKKDGEYKEKVECDGLRGGFERKVEFRDGPCKVEREWKKDGGYKEKVECDKRPRRSRALSSVVIHQDRAWADPESSYDD